MVAAAQQLTASEPDGNSGFFPIIGETIEMATNTLQFVDERKKKFGPVFRMNALGSDYVAIADGQLIEEVLASEHKTVRFDLLPALKQVASSPLFGSQDRTSHRMDRKLMMEFFTPAAIQTYYPEIEQTMREAISSWFDKPEISFVHETKKITFDIMNTNLAGVKFNDAQLAEMDELWRDFTNGALAFIPLNVPWTDFGKGMKARDSLRDMIVEALEKNYPEKDGVRAYSERNLATTFLAQKGDAGDTYRLSMAETAEIMRAVLFAGHETTAGAMCMLTYFVTNNPQVLERLRKEQTELEAKFGPHYNPAMLEGTYTEAVIKEALRFQNIDKATRSLNILFRTAIADFEIGGKQVKAGSKIMLFVGYAGYTIKDFRDTVADFNPDRWLNLESSKAPTGYLPFGAGPRVCAGEALAWAELKVYLSIVTRYTDWEVVAPDTEWKRAQGSLFNTPVDGMRMRFRARRDGLLARS